MKNKYRVVSDNYLGYESQIKYWWFPFMWFQLNGRFGMCNTNINLDQAKKLIERHKREHSPKNIYYQE